MGLYSVDRKKDIMMYNKNMVVVIKHNGRVLRENKEVVELPFGSEFTILVKNLNSRRARVRISIDGTDVFGGIDMIINANSESEFKRYVTNGNLSIGNAFKFIERTVEIENSPRGIRPDDGIIRVEYTFEKEKVYTAPIYAYPGTPYTEEREYWKKTWRAGAIGSGLYDNSSLSSTAASSVTSSTASVTDGITVPGSIVEQSFMVAAPFTAESESHVIILKLMGYKGVNPVVEAKTVKSKPKCVTCNKLNRATSKFCSSCGTSLEII